MTVTSPMSLEELVAVVNARLEELDLGIVIELDADINEAINADQRERTFALVQLILDEYLVGDVAARLDLLAAQRDGSGARVVENDQGLYMEPMDDMDETDPEIVEERLRVLTGFLRAAQQHHDKVFALSAGLPPPHLRPVWVTRFLLRGLEAMTNRNVLPPLGVDLLNTAPLKQNLPPQQILINSNNIRRKQANPEWRADKDHALPPFSQLKFERDYDESVSGDIDSSISSSSSGDKDLYQHGIRNVREEAALKRVMIPIPESATIFAPPAPPPLPAGQVLPDNIHQLLNVTTLPNPPPAQINKNQVLDDSDVEEHDLKSSEFEKIDPDRLLPIREMHTTEVPPAPLTDIDLLHLAESLSPTIQPNSEELLKIIREISPESVVDQHGRSIDILKITRSHSPNNLSPTIEDFDDISAGVSKPEKSKKQPKEAENSIEMAMAGFGKKDSNEIENPNVDILKISKNGQDSPPEKEEVAFRIEETDALKVVQRNSPNSEDEENMANILKVGIGTSPNEGKLENTDMVRVQQGESPNKRNREMGSKKRPDSEHVKHEKQKIELESSEDEANEVDILKVRRGKSPTKNRTEENEAEQQGSDSEEKEKPEKPKRSRKEFSKYKPEPENNADFLKVSRGNSPNREKAAHGAANEDEETDAFEAGKREGESEEQPTDKKNEPENETDILKVSKKAINRRADGDSEELTKHEKPEIRNKNIASKAALKDAPNVKYYYPPKTHLPLPVCFYNPTGYACCNVKLNNLIENTYSEIKASPKYNACNIQIIANKIQEAAQNEFSHPFETVAALGDFAQNVHFAGDLVCKVEIDGKYMLAYGSPYKADMAHNATGPMMQRLALFSLRI
ncbi:unnamed protein product, partial [Mesorhabditis spiculigera]